MNIKLVVIGKQEESRAELSRMLNQDEILVTGVFKDGASALSRIENVDPDIVVMALDSDESDIFSISERIYFNRPKCIVMLVARSIDVDLLQRAMRAGIRHVVPWTDNEKKLAENVKHIFNMESSRHTAILGNQCLEHTSRIVTIFGTKGGSGKTTIAVNLAVNLAKQGKKVALLDLNLQYGDANIFLNMESNDTVYELVQGYKDFDIDTIKSYMSVHSSGVEVLSAPKSPEYAEFITKEHVEKLLNIIRPYYDYVIIDVAANFNEITLLAIESSTMILMVTGLDISILRNTKISLKVLESLKQLDKVIMVINRVSKGTITVEDATKILQRPLGAAIPSDWKTVGSALNIGAPFVLNTKKTNAAIAMSRLTDIVLAGKLAEKAQHRYHNNN
jgi:pilus assembly protein CpaE